MTRSDRGRETSLKEGTLLLRDFQLTHSAREVLALAHDESRRLHHEYIGTEHLALALMRQTEGPVATVLQNLRIDVKGMRETIEAVAPPGIVESSEGTLPFTSRTQRVLALASGRARMLEQAEAGAEHILIAVLREAKGVGGQILLHHGLSEAAVMGEIRRMNSASGA